MRREGCNKGSEEVRVTHITLRGQPKCNILQVFWLPTECEGT